MSTSRYSAYLPKRIIDYLTIEDFRLRKARIRWLLTKLGTHSLEEINEQFYDLLEAEESVKDTHPYDVDWSLYDQLQSQGKEEIRCEQ